MKFKIVLFCILLSACGRAQFKDKGELKNVSKEILGLIKKHSIVADSISWKTFNVEIENEVDKLSSLDSAENLIFKIFKKLRQYGDYHSFYSNKKKSEKILSRQDSILLPTSKLLDGDIGYINLPYHLSMNKDENFLYADTLRKQIKYLDEHNNIKGWIVDLRKNSGGNMWPMLAGLNPLIEDNVVGYFVTNKSSSSWYSSSKKPQQVPKMTTIYKCKNLKNKIAVLIDTLTASSGEMTTISLLGMENSKSFGHESAGYTTANGTYKLSNGAYLFLAASFCEDRNRKIYKGKIQPDVKIENSKIIETATEFLQK